MQCNTLFSWSGRQIVLIAGDYIVEKHGVTPEEADEALIDFSPSVDDLITVIVLEDEGVVYGVNAWRSNTKDRRIYEEGELP